MPQNPDEPEAEVQSVHLSEEIPSSCSSDRAGNGAESLSEAINPASAEAEPFWRAAFGSLEFRQWEREMAKRGSQQ